MMKIIFMLTLIAVNAHAQFLDRILGRERNYVGASIKWNCPALQYDSTSVRTPPQNQDIKVQFFYDGDEPKFKFHPDIFKRGTFDISRLTSLFGEKGPPFLVEIKECAEDFKNNYKKWLEENQQDICEQEERACGKSEDIFSAFEQDLDNKEFVKNSNELISMPRFFAGHSFHSASEKEYKQSLENFCQSGQSTEDLGLITSRNFLQYVKNVASNPLIELEPSCLNRLEDFNNELALELNCDLSDPFCKRIQQDATAYQEYFTELTDGKIAPVVSAQSKKEYFAFRMGSSEISAYVGQAIKAARPSHHGRCDIDFNFQNGDSTDSILWYDKAINEALPHIAENYDKACKKRFLKNYLLNKYFSADPFESEFCQFHSCDSVREARVLFEENVQALLAGIYGPEAIQNACIDEERFRMDTREIDNFMQELDQISSCSELDQGEARVVTKSHEGIGGNYLIERLGENQLKATLAVNFVDGEEETSISAQEMFERVQNCMDVASTFFRSPFGESMRVEIINQKESLQMEASKRPGLNNINIKPKGHRDNSGNYSEDIGCAVITHEILHLMGLHDEYQEKIRGKYVDTSTGEILEGDPKELRQKEKSGQARFEMAYQCRSLAGIDSVMSNQDQLFADVLGSSVTCSCKNDDCREIMNSPDIGTRQLFTSDLWRGIEGRGIFCSSKSRAVRVETMQELEELPMHQIIDDNENSFVFEHTHMQYNIEANPANVLGWATVSRYTCGDCSDKEDCDNFEKLKEMVRNQNPSYHKGCPSFAKEVSREDLGNEESVNNSLEVEGNTFTLNSPSRRPGVSLLHPAHFTRIKYGSCESKAKNYTTCGKYAYKNPEECPDKPAMCEDVNQWLLSDQ